MTQDLPLRPRRYSTEAPPENPLSAELWHMKHASGLTAAEIARRMSVIMAVPPRDPSSVTAFIRMGSEKASVPIAFAQAIRAGRKEAKRISEIAPILARESANSRAEKRLKIISDM